MKFDPDVHHRRSIRLSGYDYSQAGAYYVTLCTNRRLCLFGDIVDDEMALNAAGMMVVCWFHELEKKFPDIHCDEFVCMPNHAHFIIMNTSADPTESRGTTPRAGLSKIVQWFKTMTTNEYIRGVKENNWIRFQATLWQRNYYEHVVRDEKDLNRIRQYINDNPSQWQWDEENPDYKPPTPSR